MKFVQLDSNINNLKSSKNKFNKDDLLDFMSSHINNKNAFNNHFLVFNKNSKSTNFIKKKYEDEDINSDYYNEQFEFLNDNEVDLESCENFNKILRESQSSLKMNENNTIKEHKTYGKLRDSQQSNFKSSVASDGTTNVMFDVVNDINIKLKDVDTNNELNTKDVNLVKRSDNKKINNANITQKSAVSLKSKRNYSNNQNSSIRDESFKIDEEVASVLIRELKEDNSGSGKSIEYVSNINRNSIPYQGRQLKTKQKSTKNNIHMGSQVTVSLDFKNKPYSNPNSQKQNINKLHNIKFENITHKNKDSKDFQDVKDNRSNNNEKGLDIGRSSNGNINRVNNGHDVQSSKKRNLVAGTRVVHNKSLLLDENLISDAAHENNERRLIAKSTKSKDSLSINRNMLNEKILNEINLYRNSNNLII